MILGGLGNMGRSIVTNPTAPAGGGPGGDRGPARRVLWTLGPLYVLYLAGILSANLALVNVLPFPPLDGGRMLVLVAQGAARRQRGSPCARSG